MNNTGTFRVIHEALWYDEKFSELSKPQPCGQYLWIYLLAGRHTSQIPGIIPHKPGAICAELEWGTEGMTAFAELETAGMIEVDKKHPLIWLPNALKYRPPRSPDNVKGWRYDWARLPSGSTLSRIQRSFAATLKHRGPKFIEEFQKITTIGSPMQSPMRSPMRSPDHRSKIIDLNKKVDLRNNNSDVLTEVHMPDPPAPAPPMGDPKGDPKGRKKRTAQKPQVEGYSEFIAEFDALFRAKRNSKPGWGAKQGEQVKMLLKRAPGLSECVTRARRMFEMAPRWPAENPDLATLVSHWDKFAPPVSPVHARDVRIGSVRPMAYDDYPEPGEGKDL